jgi:glycosyltransferase involved in cell wall biosynthesis
MTSVSVALCTYNGSRYVAEQLQSIVGQSIRPLEIVVADDGSTDRTREVLGEFAGRSAVPVIVLPSGARRGVTANFEAAIAATSGDVIALSDQDDVWREDHLARLLERLDADDRVLLAHSDARLVDADRRPLGASLFDSLRLRRHERDRLRRGESFDVLLRRNVVTGATAMIRRELFEPARPFPAAWIHDEWLAMAACARGITATIEAPLIDYRQHGQNEIGARKLGAAALARRLVAPAGLRLDRLAEKWDELAHRAEGLGFTPDRRALIQRKAAFERQRAADPASRVRRLPRILQRVARGDYARLASQGSLDALRDLLSSR